MITVTLLSLVLMNKLQHPPFINTETVAKKVRMRYVNSDCRKDEYLSN